jgi:N-acetylmuramoyl-L-alanine amidase
VIDIFKLYLDPGHGGKDPGALANGLMEKHVVLKLGKRIRDILANEYEGVAVKMSRSDDTFPSLSSRTDEANSWGANIFLSLHVNAGGGEGFESFSHTNALQKTIDIQDAIHIEIMKQIRGDRIVDRGQKRKNYHVLRETKMSSVLTENLFIDSKTDADKLKRETFLEALARGHVNGLEKAFDLKKKEIQADESKMSPGSLYRVQVGAFSEKLNAENLASELKKKGYSTHIVQE